MSRELMSDLGNSCRRLVPLSASENLYQYKRLSCRRLSWLCQFMGSAVCGDDCAMIMKGLMALKDARSTRKILRMIRQSRDEAAA